MERRNSSSSVNPAPPTGKAACFCAGTGACSAREGRRTALFDKNARPSPRRQAQLDRYSRLVDRLSPKSPMAQGLLRAFWVGGAICALGQCFIEAGLHWLDMTPASASTFASVMIVLLTALLTGVGVFDRIGQYAGAGAFVPISGFANAMVSPAMEFTREGLVLGLGAKLFTIAGPVLVWGTSASVIVGILYAIFRW
ncbi:MAG: stage V sporulation protein AC [Clostridiales bacterium]|nr:stage V sporulation protein AC [Clostridiales bacterium]